MRDKIWHKSYEPDVPFEIDKIESTSIAELFEKTCKAAGNKPAFFNYGTYLTYSELDRKSFLFASYLLNRVKLNKGDRVAIMLPNLLQYPVALYGILRAGLIVVNINPLYTATELKHILIDSQAKVILILENFAHVLETVINDCFLETVILTKIGDCFSGIKRLIANFVVNYIKRMVPSYKLPGAVAFRDILNSSPEKYPPPKIEQQDIAFLQYTGGTTGVAKGAMLTHGNILANISQIHAWVKTILIPGEEIMITALPLYHIFSLTINCLLFTTLKSLNVLITNPRDIPAFINTLKKFKFTAISGVNTLFNAVLNHPAIKEVDFSKTRFALAGGMAVQKCVAEKWEKITGCPLIEGYGLTEASPVVTANPIHAKSFNGSIGLPLPSTAVSIRNDKNQEVALGEPGELCIQGPQVMKGYWQSPEETKNIFTKDGWLKTGDIVKMDSNGFLYVVDRKKDMILVSGFNVFPNEIENIIASHPGVKEVAVVGIPNSKSGELVKAYIVKSDERITENDIIEHCTHHLTRYKVPKKIEFLDDLPKTPVGKILRRELRE